MWGSLYTKFVKIDLKILFTCGKTYLYQVIVIFQNIMTRIKAATECLSKIIVWLLKFYTVSQSLLFWNWWLYPMILFLQKVCKFDVKINISITEVFLTIHFPIFWGPKSKKIFGLCLKLRREYSRLKENLLSRFYDGPTLNHCFGLYIMKFWDKIANTGNNESTGELKVPKQKRSIFYFISREFWQMRFVRIFGGIEK